jgi:photosystem II stability/assembly factor-like uncharacterized protein
VVYARGDSGICKSTNGGSSWTAVNTGLTSTIVYSLALDPTNSQVVYAGTHGGLCKSTNGGSSWTAVNTGLTSTYNVSSLAIDPTNSRVVYSGTNGSGVFKTVTGGL